MNVNPVSFFTSHPRSVGASYLQHLSNASVFALHMIWGGIACLVHALLPFVFIDTGRACISRLYIYMISRRREP